MKQTTCCTEKDLVSQSSLLSPAHSLAQCAAAASYLAIGATETQMLVT